MVIIYSRVYITKKLTRNQLLWCLFVFSCGMNARCETYVGIHERLFVVWMTAFFVRSHLSVLSVHYEVASACIMFAVGAEGSTIICIKFSKSIGYIFVTIEPMYKLKSSKAQWRYLVMDNWIKAKLYTKHGRHENVRKMYGGVSWRQNTTKTYVKLKSREWWSAHTF